MTVAQMQNPQTLEEWAFVESFMRRHEDTSEPLPPLMERTPYMIKRRVLDNEPIQ